MRRALGGVVAMGPEVAAILDRIAADDVALHAADLELVRLQDLGNDAAADSALRVLDHLRIGNLVVLAPLVAMVMGEHGFAVLFAHETRYLPAALFIETDET